MTFVPVILLLFLALGGGLGMVAYFVYRQKLRKAKAIERGLKMVPVKIHLPPPSSDTKVGTRDIKEVMREKTAQAEVLYNLLAGTATSGFRSTFYGQRHIALELIAADGLVHFYVAVPVALVSTVEKAIQTAYPGARMEMVEDHNIFNQEGRLAATLGGEMVLRADSAYPIATYAKLERDPMEALLTTVSALQKHDGVGVQLMVRPASPQWVAKALRLAGLKRKGRSGGGFTPMDLAKAALKAPGQRAEEQMARMGGQALGNLQQDEISNIEDKTKHPGFEVLVRVVVSTDSVVRSQQLLRDIATTFALYDAPGLNGFKFLPAVDVQGLVTAFIFRFFPPELNNNVLNSVELATLFHLPDAQFTPTAAVERQQSKQVDGPARLPSVGLLFGFNEFRGVKKEIRLSSEDRRRHTYILGQTGTGKSTMLENLAVQDMLAGNGFAFIDPHGDSAEKLLALVPKERAEDVIYFNPSDTAYPLGLNLFEFSDPMQKDFLVQETINMLYKLYDPGKTGIIGPRFEQWYRNAALTLMSDPNGSTFIEIPKVFTDTEYLKNKFRYLKDPTVIEFWTKEMGQTSDYHKSEMLGWFASKFGAFQNNEMMRNIIGQTKSAFNLREVMDQKKILIVNLSKGKVGELNSQLLGMIFVIKFQAAAMSRADMLEADRNDFCLYVDEFQNFSTDSFASILSEARKYRLNLIVANQFVGQLKPEIRDAVFGNIGTIVAHRMGPEDADFMVKQFAPVFDASDLMNIPNYNAAMRLMIGGLPSQPFTIVDNPPIGSPNLELGLAVKQLSAAKYGHEKAVVEADIAKRMASPAPTGLAPVATPAPEPTLPSAPAPAPAPVSTPEPPAPVSAPVVSAPVGPAPSVGAANPAPAPIPAMPGAPVPGVALAPVQPVVSGIPAAPTSPAPGLASSPAPAASAGPAEPKGLTALQLLQEQARAGQLGHSVVEDPMAASTTPAQSAAPGAVLSAPPIGAPPVDLPVSPNPAPMPASAPAPASPVMSVPPIGAPPVDLGGGPVKSAPRPSEAGTLSIMDITGGVAPGINQSKPLDDVPLLEEGAGMPAPEQPGAPVPGGVSVVAPAPVDEVLPQLGMGEPLPNDPYANIDVLGDLTPPAVPALQAVPLTEEESVTAPRASAEIVQDSQLVSGEPLPGDPYGSVGILGDDTGTEAPVVPRHGETAAESVPASVPEPAPVRDSGLMPGDAGDDNGGFIHFVDPAAEGLLHRRDVPLTIEPVGFEAEGPDDRGGATGEAATQPISASVPVQASAPVDAAVSVDLAQVAPLAMQDRDYEGPAPVSPVPRPEPELKSVPASTLAPPPAPAPAPELVPSAPVSGPVSGLAPVSEPAGQPVEPVKPAPVAAPAPVAQAVTPAVPVAPDLSTVEVVKPLSENKASIPAGKPIEEPKPLPEKLQSPVKEVVVSEPPRMPLDEPKPQPVAPMPKSEPVPPPAPAPELTSPVPEPVGQPVEPVKPASVPAPAPVAQAVTPAVPVIQAVPVAPVAPVASAQSGKETSEHTAPPALPPVSVPQSASAPVSPEPRVTAEERVQKAEHRIDDLLSESLIKPLSQHHRLADPALAPAGQSEANMGIIEEKPAQDRSLASEGMQRHGIKVINPIEPIVPRKEELAKELAALEMGDKPKPVPASKPKPVPEPKPSPAPEPVKPAVSKPAPVSSQPEAKFSSATPVIAKHSGAMLPQVPEGPREEEVELPQAESLAADDVARQRAAREAEAKLHLSQRPHPEAEQKPLGNQKQPSQQSRRLPFHREGRVRLSDQPKPVERRVQEPQEAQSAPMTGQLIMPTALRQKPAPDMPVQSKPKRLAPGEVYVDEHGNVVVGE